MRIFEHVIEDIACQGDLVYFNVHRSREITCIQCGYLELYVKTEQFTRTIAFPEYRNNRSCVSWLLALKLAEDLR